MKNVNPTQRKRGFTLIELILVILVMAVLIGIAIAGGSATIKKSQVSRTESDLHNFSLAIEAAMNETPNVANLDKADEMEADIIKTVNANLAAEYQLTEAPAWTTDDGNNLIWKQSNASTDSYVIYKSAKTDAWGNPYYVVFDATERHNDGISEFYITVVSAGPNAQTTIATKTFSNAATDGLKDLFAQAEGFGIEADDVFLLVQYTDGDVSSKTYNCAKDTLLSGGAASSDVQTTLLKTTKGTKAAAASQGHYVGETLNGDGRASQCPVNFQPVA